MLEIGITILVQVHLHAVDDLLEMFFAKVVTPDSRSKGFAHGVLRVALVKVGDLRAPPCKLGACDTDIVAFIGDIIDFATECIQSSDGSY